MSISHWGIFPGFYAMHDNRSWFPCDFDRWAATRYSPHYTVQPMILPKQTPYYIKIK